MDKRSTLTGEQRTRLVLRLMSKEAPAAQIARRAGISEQTPYRWREEFIDGGKQALNGQVGQSEQAKAVERLSAEVAERDQVIGELTIANRVLKKTFGRVEPSVETRSMITSACQQAPRVRLSRVLEALGVARSVWYARRKSEPKRPGRKRKPVPEGLAETVRGVACEYPWWGYKRIAVVARRAGVAVTNKQVYKVMKAAGLLQKRRVRKAELYQAARLFELLPSAPNELWQADVTYIHIPGHGWWYAVTVIDYYSRYLLACHFTASYRAADVNAALDAARVEAEELHGPLSKSPFLVTDNGSSFLARAFRRHIDGAYAHVRIGYRTPTQLGLLERFHQTLKSEEVYWKLYASPGEARESLAVFRQRYNQVRPHWALVPPDGGDPVTPAEVYVHRQPVGLPKWQGWAKAAREKLNAIIEDAHFPSAAEPAEVTA